MRFRIENGKAAIYDQSVNGDAPLHSPYSYIDDLKWHNEFEHIGIVEIRDYSVTLPVSNDFSPPREKTWVLDTHDQPAEPFVYGYVIPPGGGARPFAMHAVVNAAVDTRSLAGILPHGFLRQVSIGVDGPNIVLHEWARGTFWGGSGRTHPSATIGIKVFITDLSLSVLADGSPYVPSRKFTISKTGVQLGPFSADKRWLRKKVGAAQFPLVNGTTMEAHNALRWRYRIPSASAFAYTVAVGSAPDVTSATAVDVDA